MENQIIQINLIPNLSTPAVVRVSQYDVGRPLVFKVYDGTSPADLTGVTAVIEGTKRSGLGFSESGTVADNTVTLDTTLAMTQEDGSIPAEIRFTKTGENVGTANFILAVEPSPHLEGTTDGTQETMQNLETRLQGEIDSLEEDVERLNDGGLIIKDEIIEQDIANWLNDHPEATTTVQDGSITRVKFAQSLNDELKNSLPQHYGSVQKFYVDRISGDDENDGLTSGTAFKTINKGLELLNAGYVNLGLIFCSSGTYEIGSKYNLCACSLHFETVNNCDVTITSASEKFVAYACHLNFTGGSGHPIIIDIPTLRFDAGELWCDYVEFTTTYSNNGCNARLNNCIFDDCLQINHGNMFLSAPTIKNKNNTNTCITIYSGVVLIRDSMTIVNPTGTLPSDSRIVAILGGTGGFMPNTSFNTISQKYAFGIRTYGGSWFASGTEKNNILSLCNKAIEASGVLWMSGDPYAYHAGDSETIASNARVVYVGKWNSATSLRFTIPLCKAIDATSVSISGALLVSTQGDIYRVTLGNGNTVSAQVTKSGVGVLITFAQDQSIAAINYPVVIQCDGINIDFS